MTETDHLRTAHWLLTRRCLVGLKKTTVHKKELAVAAALHFCAEERLHPAKVGIGRISPNFYATCSNAKRRKLEAAPPNCLARYRQSMWDVERWDTFDQASKFERKTHLTLPSSKLIRTVMRTVKKAHNQKDAAVAATRHFCLRLNVPARALRPYRRRGHESQSSVGYDTPMMTLQIQTTGTSILGFSGKSASTIGLRRRVQNGCISITDALNISLSSSLASTESMIARMS